MPLCRSSGHPPLHGPRSGQEGAVRQTGGRVGMWSHPLYSPLRLPAFLRHQGALVWGHHQGEIQGRRPSLGLWPRTRAEQRGCLVTVPQCASRLRSLVTEKYVHRWHQQKKDKIKVSQCCQHRGFLRGAHVAQDSVVHESCWLVFYIEKPAFVADLQFVWFVFTKKVKIGPINTSVESVCSPRWTPASGPTSQRAPRTWWGACWCWTLLRGSPSTKPSTTPGWRQAHSHTSSVCTMGNFFCPIKQKLVAVTWSSYVFLFKPKKTKNKTVISTNLMLR